MEVHLNNITPLHIVASAIRQCWQSQGNSDTLYKSNGNPYWIDKHNNEISGCGPKDKELIHRIGNKFKHSSTLEHLVMNFTIIGTSRALLQELARHRMASPSVKSTRYTLKELKNESYLYDKKVSQFELYSKYIENMSKDDTYKTDLFKQASKYLVYTNDRITDLNSIISLEGLKFALKLGVPNDKAKYCLPESYKTSYSWTINARSLQNFLHLRTSKSALWEIRKLAFMIYETLPEEYKYLFIDNLEDIEDMKD